MNILPHKSWHVRTKKNIEKVRRDEEKAAEEEKEKQRRIALAEQEARTDLLRARSKNKALIDGGSLSVSDKSQPSAHQDLFPVTLGRIDTAIPGLGEKREFMNFFKDIEDGVVKQGKNKEHQEEKKKEQEEFEKKIGLLTYLGQSSLESKESAPWFLKKLTGKGNNQNKDDSQSETQEDKEKKLRLDIEERRKKFMDPLTQMKEFVDKKKRHHNTLKHSDRKEKISDRSRSTSSLSKPSTVISSSKKTIEQLRAERLARERQENMRTRSLLTKSVRETDGTSSMEKDSREDEMEERRGGKRKYNSQYNPDFVRQPKSRHRDDFH
uniref:CBF1-interacting co-repressor CIR N-terminal domain-containing protein n=1 Tax=Arion vulgaris TaxID=1028688 RepID=A0A0B7A7J6_9EUPU